MRLPSVAAWLLGGLIALLSVWRLVELGHLLVWHDEVFTLVRVLGFSQPDVQQAVFSSQLLTPDQLLAFQRGPAASVGATLGALTQHPEHAPLYYLLARAALVLPLDPVTAVRGASAIFAVLLPAIAFWLIHELFGRDPLGSPKSCWDPLTWPAPWAAAVLVAASPIHLLYAQEARQYALWTVLTGTASAALIRAWREDRLRDWASYAMLVALGLYSHLLFVLLIPVHALYALINGAGWHRNWRLLGDKPARHLLGSIAVAMLLFSPWIAVAVLHADRVDHYTSWMERPLPTPEILLAWLHHVTRFFVDLSPEFVGLSLVLLAPVIWGLGIYLRDAPRPAVWLLPLIAVTYIAIVLGQDLLLGGSRSHHPRYVLPAAFAIQLMAAWGLAQATLAVSRRTRALGYFSLISLVAAGILSLSMIQRADSWWTKNFSSVNQRIAETINSAGGSLVVASPSGVATGELISLAYHLDPDVALWGESTPAEIPAGFTHVFALTPSPAVTAELEPLKIEPIGASWQWFRARPIGPAPASPSARDPLTMTPSTPSSQTP